MISPASALSMIYDELDGLPNPLNQKAYIPITYLRATSGTHKEPLIVQSLLL